MPRGKTDQPFLFGKEDQLFKTLSSDHKIILKELEKLHGRRDKLEEKIEELEERRSEHEASMEIVRKSREKAQV